VLGRRIDDVLRSRPANCITSLETQLLRDGIVTAEMTRMTAADCDIAVHVRWSLRRHPTGAPADVVEISRSAVGPGSAGEAPCRSGANQDHRNGHESGEQRYRSLFHFVPVPVFRINRSELASVFEKLKAEGVKDLFQHSDTHSGFHEFAMSSMKIVEVNRKAIELFGAQNAEEILGPTSRLWSESPEIALKGMQHRFHGGASFEAQMKFRTFDNRVLDVLYLTDFPEAMDNPALGLACLIDISDRVKTQETLQHLQAEFAHAARVSTLGELTASIAHEVSQPLTAIEANTEACLLWLDRSPQNIDELRKLSLRNAVEVQRAADIVHRIRAMALRAEPEHKSIELNAIIEEAISFLRHEIQRHGVKARLELISNLPTISADRVQLQQVVVNLVINAVQAMGHSDDVRGELTIRTLPVGLNTVCVEVEDNGPGIAIEHIASLFDSFFTTKTEGMGIGLPISRSIIEAHGGRLEAANRMDGSGARFWFTLPIASAPA
jgi:signal transduction histidine kinase